MIPSYLKMKSVRKQYDFTYCKKNYVDSLNCSDYQTMLDNESKLLYDEDTAEIQFHVDVFDDLKLVGLILRKSPRATVIEISQSRNLNNLTGFD